MFVNILRSLLSLFIFLVVSISSLSADVVPTYKVMPDAVYKIERKIFIKQQGSKYGLVNKKGKEVLPPKYDSLSYTELDDQYIAFLQNNKGLKEAGIITEKDKKVIPIGYKGINPVALTLYAVTNFNGNTALFNSEGKQKSDFIFHQITAYKGKLARFYKNGKAGIINREGRVLLEAEFKDIIIRSDTTVDVIHLRNWKILDGTNKELNNLHFDSIRPVGQNRWATSIRFYNAAGQPTLMTALTDVQGKQLIEYRPMYIYNYEGTLAKIKEARRFGVINRDGNYILPSEFDSIALTKEAIIAGTLVNRQWSWHLFDLNGKIKSRNTYQAIVPLEDDLMPAKLNNRWGYISSKGEEVLTCRYDTTFAFNGNLACVGYDNSMGVINREGLWQIRPSADHITIISPTRFIARNKNSFQLLDETGQVLFSTPHALHPVEGGLLEINAQMQYGLFDYDGKRLTPTEYERISDLKEGIVFLARKDGRKGILSKNGKKFIAEGPKTFDRLFSMHEDFLAVEIDQQQGFVDTEGRLRISNRYDSVTHFSDGFAAVQLMGRWGYIDKIERLRIQPLYEQAGPFEDGMGIISKNGYKGLINKKGEEVIKAEYEDITSLKSGRYLIVKNGKVGITDKNANTLVTAKYDSIQDLKNGFFLVTRSGKKGLINYQGVSTIPMIYDILLWDEINKVFLCSEKGESIERMVIR